MIIPIELTQECGGAGRAGGKSDGGCVRLAGWLTGDLYWRLVFLLFHLLLAAIEQPAGSRADTKLKRYEVQYFLNRCFVSQCTLNLMRKRLPSSGRTCNCLVICVRGKMFFTEDTPVFLNQHTFTSILRIDIIDVKMAARGRHQQARQLLNPAVQNAPKRDMKIHQVCFFYSPPKKIIFCLTSPARRCSSGRTC